jgi:hypothetical protein
VVGPFFGSSSGSSFDPRSSHWRIVVLAFSQSRKALARMRPTCPSFVDRDLGDVVEPVKLSDYQPQRNHGEQPAANNLHKPQPAKAAPRAVDVDDAADGGGSGDTNHLSRDKLGRAIGRRRDW